MIQKTNTQQNLESLVGLSADAQKASKKLTRQEIMEFWEGGQKEKFLSKIKIAENECWNWVAGKTSCGYGAFYINGKQILSHRMSYLVHVGELVNGLDIDHLCRNRACCNPKHLEQVTRRENLIRGETVASKNLKVTHCPKGHKYTKENTIIKQTGWRDCKKCANIRTKERYHKMKSNKQYMENRREISRKSYQKQIKGGAI